MSYGKTASKFRTVASTIHRASPKNLRKPTPKPSQIDIKFVLRMFSAPNRAQVGSRTLPGIGGTAPFGASWAENVALRARFGTQRER